MAVLLVVTALLASAPSAAAGTTAHLELSSYEWTLVRAFDYDEQRRFEAGWNRGVDVLASGGIVRAPSKGRVRTAGTIFGRGVVTIESVFDSHPVIVTLTGLENVQVHEGQRVDAGTTVGRGTLLHVGMYDPDRRTRYLPVRLGQPTGAPRDGGGASSSTGISGRVADRLEAAIRGEVDVGSIESGSRQVRATGRAERGMGPRVPRADVVSRGNDSQHGRHGRALAERSSNARAAGVGLLAFVEPSRPGASSTGIGVAEWVLTGRFVGTGSGSSDMADHALSVARSGGRGHVEIGSARRRDNADDDRRTAGVPGGSSSDATAMPSGPRRRAALGVSVMPPSPTGLLGSRMDADPRAVDPTRADGPAAVGRAAIGDGVVAVRAVRADRDWVRSLLPLVMILSIILLAFLGWVLRHGRSRRSHGGKTVDVVICSTLMPDAVVAVRGLGRLVPMHVPVRDAAWASVESGSNDVTSRRSEARAPESTHA